MLLPVRGTRLHETVLCIYFVLTTVVLLCPLLSSTQLPDLSFQNSTPPLLEIAPLAFWVRYKLLHLAIKQNPHRQTHHIQLHLHSQSPHLPQKKMLAAAPCLMWKLFYPLSSPLGIHRLFILPVSPPSRSILWWHHTHTDSSFSQ